MELNETTIGADAVVDPGWGSVQDLFGNQGKVADLSQLLVGVVAVFIGLDSKESRS